MKVKKKRIIGTVVIVAFAIIALRIGIETNLEV